MIILAFLWISTESANRVPLAGSTLVLGNFEIIGKCHNSSPPRALLALLEKAWLSLPPSCLLPRFMDADIKANGDEFLMNLGRKTCA